MNHKKFNCFNSSDDLMSYQAPFVTPIAGQTIGIIAVNFNFPKLPGNVSNASTFKFPVVYEVIDIDPDALLAGDASVQRSIIDAAQRLEKRGVMAIVGACGYFAHFQKEVRESVSVPVFMSSLIQIPMIKMGLKQNQKIAVYVASADDVDAEFLSCVDADIDNCYIVNISELDKFKPIINNQTELDNAGLTKQLIQKTNEVVNEHDDIGAILIECSDLPPYAYAIQNASDLPVFDFVTMINYVWSSVVQTPYYGFF